MNKKEEFKTFVNSKPELVDLIKNKEYTWQELYETYDLYGEKQEIWDKYKTTTKEEKNDTLGELTKIVKNINIDNVQKYITNAQKAINIIQELTTKEIPKIPSNIPKTAKTINKFFGD